MPENIEPVEQDYYYAKPPKFLCIQWDGSQKTVQKILYQIGKDAKAEMRWDGEIRLTISHSTLEGNEVPVGSWLVISPQFNEKYLGREFVIMSDQKFRLLYQPVDSGQSTVRTLNIH